MKKSQVKTQVKKLKEYKLRVYQKNTIILIASEKNHAIYKLKQELTLLELQQMMILPHLRLQIMIQKMIKRNKIQNKILINKLLKVALMINLELKIRLKLKLIRIKLLMIKQQLLLVIRQQSLQPHLLQIKIQILNHPLLIIKQMQFHKEDQQDF